MADASPNHPNLKTHPLVEQLLGNGDTPPDVITVTGFFGPSRKADSIRVYTSLDFQSYFEVPTEAILATTPVDANDEDSPTVAFVKAGTEVSQVQTSTLPIEAYLDGAITAGSLATAASSADGYATPLWATPHSLLIQCGGHPGPLPRDVSPEACARGVTTLHSVGGFTPKVVVPEACARGVTTLHSVGGFTPKFVLPNACVHGVNTIGTVINRHTIV